MADMAVTVFTTPDHTSCLEGVVKSPTRSARVGVRSYDWLFTQASLPNRTYIFADMERLALHELVEAAQAYKQLKRARARVLNDPAQVRTRLPLLRELHASGINAFQAYEAYSRPRPKSFPVFIRSETDHSGGLGGLIPDQASLDAELARLEGDGVPLRHLLVIEFSAEPIREGAYRKHSVFRVGEAFLSYSPVIEDDWCVKSGTAAFSTDRELDEAAAEMNENPFGERLRPVFELARIEYGRVDFGLVGDRLSVFEINTNPHLSLPPKAHRHASYASANKAALERIVGAICAQDSDRGGAVALGQGARQRRRRSWTRLLLGFATLKKLRHSWLRLLRGRVLRQP